MGNQASQRSVSSDRSSEFSSYLSRRESRNLSLASPTSAHEFIRSTFGRGVDRGQDDVDDEGCEDERIPEGIEREYELKPIEGKMHRNLCKCARSHTRVDIMSVIRPSGKRTLYVGRQLSSKASKTDVAVAENDLKMVCYLPTLHGSLGKHRHPNIIELLGHFAHVNSLHIITKYYELGNLMTMLDTAAKLKGANDKTLPHFQIDKSVRALIHDIFLGVVFIHRSGVGHLDLALENIYIGLDGQFRVGDFRHARFVGSANRCQAAPPPVRKVYAAPELHSGREIDLLKTDAWPLGVIVLMVLTMETPFSEATIRNPKYQRLQLWGLSKLLEDLISECELEISIPKDMHDLLLGLLCCNPEHRTSILRSVDTYSWLQASDAQIPVTDAGADNSTTSSSSSCNTQTQSSEVEQKYECLKLPLVNGATICAKARKIQAELQQSASPSATEGLKALRFSSGWLFKFQKRNCLSSKRTHGEASSTSDAAVGTGRVLLKEVTSGHERHNILNMDETAYFYCAAPTPSITRDRISGRKQIKKQLTVAVACSADDSHKLPLFFVGTARQPRCFGSKNAEGLDLKYGNSPKGWMNTELSQGWVSRLDARMRSESRSVLLLLDNVSSHRAPETLTHVEIRMLPPNTTAHVQPLDAGIIRNFKSTISKKKALYYANQPDEILSRVEEVEQETVERELEAIGNIDVLVAMRWAQEA